MTRPPRLEPLAVMSIARARFFWNQVATQLNEEYTTMLHRESSEWIAKEWFDNSERPKKPSTTPRHAAEIRLAGAIRVRMRRTAGQ